MTPTVNPVAGRSTKPVANAGTVKIAALNKPRKVINFLMLKDDVVLVIFTQIPL